MHPARRPQLGQHFLRDPRLRRRIAESLDLLPDDLVVEIGPGHGEMTELLAQRAPQVTALEIDAHLAELLQEEFGGRSGIEILQADILATDLGSLCRRHGRAQCFVFGNLPYYITSPILHHLFSFASCIRAMALLMQREVAERVVAQPGSRAYGYLSVLAQLHAQPRITLEVPPGAFSPPPQVDSALVDFRMVPRFVSWTTGEIRAFLDFVKRCFAQKRRNLRNNLAGIYARNGLEQALMREQVLPNARAEQLTLEQFGRLFRRLHVRCC
ncbi:MAG: 16S rRNA (adenine(1518)-N(6)/adenine(1519)-N(6))-dimethyltransferase RsmA [Acidobacteriia bacterium]|nr:16S rRNA (adenine(1518)-N(6)/adenine(1519)-N(6))-dimethyltransferase RsmA [Terriglobia bacterium]